MLFAIDIDGTYAAAPGLFHQIVRLIRDHGHSVIFVTGRTEEPKSRTECELLTGHTAPVLMTGHTWKRTFAAERGYVIDIWIDDLCTEIRRVDYPGDEQ